MNRRKKRIAERVGAYVRDRYSKSVEARRELFDQMKECVRLMDGDHEADVDGVDVDVNIVAPITRGVKSLLRDILGNDADDPFTVAATPVADLPADVETRLVQRIAQQMPQIMQVVQTEEDFEQFLQAARNSAVLAMNREAVRRARGMETKVKDDLKEADWPAAFDAFLDNFCLYPYAVLKSPSMRMKRWKEWDGMTMVASERLLPMVENISPFDFGWAPNAGNIAAAEYLWERRPVGADELLDMANEDGYDPEMIEYIFEQLPAGYAEPYDDGREVEKPVEESELNPDDSVLPDELGYYDAIGFYGRIKGEYLREFGVEVDDDRRWYESIVWTIKDIPFQVTLNPDPIGARPFHVASYDAIPGQIAGRSPAMKLQDVQRVCRAAVRALIRNMAYASGVVGEVEVDRIADDDDPRVLQANVMRLVNAARSGQAGTAYAFHKIDSNAAELMGVFDKFYALGYEVIGIPRMAFGGTEGLGTIGRTSGGMALIMNQASKTLKDALRSLEGKAVVPVVQGFIDWNNSEGDDPSIKGDVRAYARGVSGILERETMREKLAWALQSIAPLVSAGVVPPAAAQRLLYALFQANGVDTEGVLPDFDMMAALGADATMAGIEAAGVPGADGGTGLQPPGSEVTLDGRSANAAGAIENMNSL